MSDKLLEAAIESLLVRKVEEVGGRAPKFVPVGNRGVPDRLVFLPGGRLVLVELKAPGRRPTKLQLKRHREFRQLGFDVEVIDTKEGVVEFLAREGYTVDMKRRQRRGRPRPQTTGAAPARHDGEAESAGGGPSVQGGGT